MIYELAHIEIQPGTQEKFEAGVQAAAPLFQRAKGCHGMELRQVLEDPNTYLLVVQWETLEDHTVHFRGPRTSRHGARWWAAISPSRRKSGTPPRSPSRSDAAAVHRRPRNLLDLPGRIGQHCASPVRIVRFISIFVQVPP